MDDKRDLADEAARRRRCRTRSPCPGAARVRGCAQRAAKLALSSGVVVHPRAGAPRGAASRHTGPAPRTTRRSRPRSTSAAAPANRSAPSVAHPRLAALIDRAPPSARQQQSHVPPPGRVTHAADAPDLPGKLARPGADLDAVGPRQELPPHTGLVQPRHPPEPHRRELRQPVLGLPPERKPRRPARPAAAARRSACLAHDASSPRRAEPPGRRAARPPWPRRRVVVHPPPRRCR
jgi:hypothetical protein